jgi:hypothetical protein
MTNKVEREGEALFPNSTAPHDVSVILRQIRSTYNLICWVNADDIRYGEVGYLLQYSFVILPLVRTMIDGFYNATALLDDPTRARKFRISGYFRKREALRADEARYGSDPEWAASLADTRARLTLTMRVDGFSDADLDDKGNMWPLLGKYLEVTKANPDTKHKQLLRHLTLGFWKEYSSVSHASFDGLGEIYPFIATDRLPHEMREQVKIAGLRRITMHIGRAAGLLLCLLTELQHFFRFDDFDIDKRLKAVWEAMVPLYEVRELYEFRYKSILRAPISTQATPQEHT